MRVIPHSVGTLQNVATVSSATSDPNDGNNQSQATTTVQQFGRGSVQVTVQGTGSVASQPAGIACPGDCRESYATGTVVTLTATPADRFKRWSGACMGMNPTKQVVIRRGTVKICRAIFRNASATE